MDKRQLRDSFLGSLQKMHDMELVAPLMEFCQGEMRVLLYLDAHKKETVYPSTLSDSLSAYPPKNYYHPLRSPQKRIRHHGDGPGGPAADAGSPQLGWRPLCDRKTQVR